MYLCCHGTRSEVPMPVVSPENCEHMWLDTHRTIKTMFARHVSIVADVHDCTPPPPPPREEGG